MSNRCLCKRYASRIKRLMRLRSTARLWCFFDTLRSTCGREPAADGESVGGSRVYTKRRGYKLKEEPLEKSCVISFLLHKRSSFRKV